MVASSGCSFFPGRVAGCSPYWAPRGAHAEHGDARNALWVPDGARAELGTSHFFLFCGHLVVSGPSLVLGIFIPLCLYFPFHPALRCLLPTPPPLPSRLPLYCPRSPFSFVASARSRAHRAGDKIAASSADDCAASRVAADAVTIDGSATDTETKLDGAAHGTEVYVCRCASETVSTVFDATQASDCGRVAARAAVADDLGVAAATDADRVTAAATDGGAAERVGVYGVVAGAGCERLRRWLAASAGRWRRHRRRGHADLCVRLVF